MNIIYSSLLISIFCLFVCLFIYLYVCLFVCWLILLFFINVDSLATKTAGAFLKIVAKEYLANTIGPTVRDVLAAPAGYEVDQNKLAEGENRDENMARLSAMSGTALERITDSLPELPMAVRVFLERLKRRVERKFPGARLKAIGAFMFLRFMQPSIFSPEGFGLIDAPPPRDARRALILVAKVLQNLANGVKFGNKEAYMAELNQFVMANVEELFYFLDEISSTHGRGKLAHAAIDGAASEASDAAALDEAWVTVLSHLYTHRERVEVELGKLGRADSREWATVKRILGVIEQHTSKPAPAASPRGPISPRQ